MLVVMLVYVLVLVLALSVLDLGALRPPVGLD